MSRSALLVFLAALAFHAAFAFALGGPTDFDACFHARVSQMLLSGEMPWHGTAFPWLTCSAWADLPCDWALGWHWIVAPFTRLSDPLAVLAVAQVVFAAALTTVFHGVLVRAGAGRPWLWTALLLLGSAGWLYRTHQGRPTTTVVALAILIVAAVVADRPLLAGGAALASILVYCVPTPPLIFGACAAVGALARDRRIPWRAGLAVVAGVAVGVLVHPGTWSVGPGGAFSLDRADVHLWRLMAGSVEFASRGGAVVADMGGGARAEFAIALPSELVAPGGADYLGALRVPFVATLVAVVAALRNRRDAWTVSTALAALVGFAMTARSGRFFEYWYPFAVLAAAMSLGGRGGALSVAPAPVAGRITTAGVALAILSGIVQLPEAVRESAPGLARTVGPAADAITAAARPGDVVFQGAWDDFAPGFYHARGVRWLTGMDPWYFVAHDPTLVAWHAAVAGNAVGPEEIRRTITERFHARFVLLWRRPGREDRYDALERVLASAPWAERIHHDAAATVFSVR